MHRRALARRYEASFLPSYSRVRITNNSHRCWHNCGMAWPPSYKSPQNTNAGEYDIRASERDSSCLRWQYTFASSCIALHRWTFLFCHRCSIFRLLPGCYIATAVPLSHRNFNSSSKSPNFDRVVPTWDAGYVSSLLYQAINNCTVFKVGSIPHLFLSWKSGAIYYILDLLRLNVWRWVRWRVAQP